MSDFKTTKWGLEHNLFITSPPEDSVLGRVFTGRERELRVIRDTVFDAPRRVLLNGLFGTGKTVMIREMSRRVREEGRAVLFIEEMLSHADLSIAHVILRGLAAALKDEDTYAQQIYEQCIGLTVERNDKEEQEFQVEAGLPKFVATANKEHRGSEVKSTMKNLPPDLVLAIRRLIQNAQARNGKRRIIIVIDDLDKRDPDTIRQLLVGSRDLIHNPQCSFIFTGHPIGVMRDIYSSAGGIIDREVEVPRMESEVLKLLIARYLGAGRRQRSAFGRAIGKPPEFQGEKVGEEEIVPFTPSSVDEIIRRSQGIPRLLNIICYNILVEAEQREMERIDVDELAQCWDAAREQLRNGIRPDLRDTLELMAQQKEPLNVNEIPDEFYERSGNLTREEVIERLDHALKNDLLVTKDGNHLELTSVLQPFSPILGGRG